MSNSLRPQVLIPKGHPGSEHHLCTKSSVTESRTQKAASVESQFALVDMRRHPPGVASSPAQWDPCSPPPLPLSPSLSFFCRAVREDSRSNEKSHKYQEISIQDLGFLFLPRLPGEPPW